MRRSIRILPCWDVAEVSLETGSEEELLCPVQLMVWDETRRIFMGCAETSVRDVWIGSLAGRGLSGGK
jgi:hypothetical protein